MHLVVIGFNHKRAQLALREAVALDREGSVKFAKKLNSQDVIEESLVISTCNRTEVYAVGPCVEGVREVIYQTLAEETGRKATEFIGASYSYSDDQALKHLFRVASSLDAMVVGEAQVLGQLKGAYQAAVEYDTAGPYLHKSCHLAFRVAKKVRTETDIALFPVSVGTLAVELVEDVLGDLKTVDALIIGAGEMGALVAGRLKDRGVLNMKITNRTEDTAVTLANAVSGVVVPFESWRTCIDNADIVITSIGGGVLITYDNLNDILAMRGKKPLLIIDLAVPRNVETVSSPSLKIYNIDDLKELANKNLASRKEAADKAELIVEEEARTAFQELKHLKLAPLIKELQKKCELVMKTELERVYSSHPTLNTEEKEDISRCAEAIVKKILHDPIRLAKEELARPGANGSEISATLHKIFHINTL